MHVFLNQREGAVQIKGDLITFKPTHSTENNLVRFAASEVTQLLCSRKDEKAAKLVAADRTYLIRFDNGAMRREFVDGVVKAQASKNHVEEVHHDWITSTLCEVAVEVGILNEAELQEILREESHRGVVQTFDALESLVDRNTFRLKPITEQMQNDVFRQIPVLAAIFEKHVVDGETRKGFWEDVVRKYFCFSRTFLDEQVEKVMQEAEGTTIGENTSPPTTSASIINASSERALPKQVIVSQQKVDSEGDEIEEIIKQTQAESLHVGPTCMHAFSARRPLPKLSFPSTSVATNMPSLTMISNASERPQVYAGHGVRTTLPSEPTRKEALETLRKIWRSAPKQRKALLDNYKNSKKSQTVSFIETECFKQVENLIQSGN
ncbi:unnamed protein product [Phytomonas sp. EM1]|nr:unnamed protein product [Phytomonas sp. EM1]|eukprot:CCW65635.1 unnamed protein product [Phytomonas sp. isolate EM1]